MLYLVTVKTLKRLMKLDSLLAQYLYNHKEVTLQGIGKFVLNSEIAIPFDKEKEQPAIPEGSIEFTYNSRATEDEGLVSFIVEQTKKMRPLVSSDIESYLLLGKQFLNIGKPFFIEGIGTLTKIQNGGYDFAQGLVANIKQEVYQTAAREKAVEEISFASEEKSTVDFSKIIKSVGIALLLGAVGVGIWFLVQYFTNRKASAEKTPTESVQTNNVADTTRTKIDTSAVSANPNKVVSNDGSTFNLVLKTYKDSTIANLELAKFMKKGHKLKLVAEDSSYVLKMPLTLNIADSARIRDSVRSFYFPNFKVTIQ